MSENYTAERGLEKTRKLIQKVGIEGIHIRSKRLLSI